MKALALNPKCQPKGFWFNRSTEHAAFCFSIWHALHAESD
jgi:hypothetical protein